MLKLSEFLKNNITPFIYGVFMSRIMEEVRHNQKFFYAYTKFKMSKCISKEEFNIIEYVKTSYIKELNYFSKVDN
jgi:hypothetical protein